MEQVELFTNLAAIAGVFVGFGALISVRSERARDEEVMMIRMIVLFGILVVITALVPVMLSGYGVTGHRLWVTSSWVFLVLWWGSSILNRWDTERTRVLSALARRQRMWGELPGVPFWVAMNGALILILTGMFPDQEPALYATAVTMNLFLDAGMLVYLVYLQPRPGSDRGETASPESHVNLPTPVEESRPIA
jgi:small-conductance mechanosensitive channel